MWESLLVIVSRLTKSSSDNITNSFCWVHIRRELRQLLVSYPEIAALCTHLLTLIGSLYFHNVARQLAEPNSNAKQAADKALRDNMAVIRATCENHLTGQKLHSELRRVCAGILKDWEGLVIFMDIPEIPPDNNPAERALPRASGRKKKLQWKQFGMERTFSSCDVLAE